MYSYASIINVSFSTRCWPAEEPMSISWSPAQSTIRFNGKLQILVWLTISPSYLCVLGCWTKLNVLGCAKLSADPGWQNVLASKLWPCFGARWAWSLWRLWWLKVIRVVVMGVLSWIQNVARWIHELVQYCSTCRVPLQGGAEQGHLDDAGVGQDGDARQEVDWARGFGMCCSAGRTYWMAF